MNKILTYLVVDTETTGLCNMRLPYNESTLYPQDIDSEFWPWITEITFNKYQLTDGKSVLVKENSYFITPSYEHEMYSIEAREKTGISIEKLATLGEPLALVMKLFLAELKSVDFVVAHNSTFDMKVIKAAFFRCDIDYHLRTVPWIDTMYYGREFLGKVFGRYKYPKLSELFYKLIGKTPEKVHDSVSDVDTTNKCFIELINKGELTIDRINARIKLLNQGQPNA